MRIYGVDPEVTYVTHLVDCPVCKAEQSVRVTMLIDTSEDARCRKCWEMITVRWVFDETEVTNANRQTT